ncbi:hypothetical protein PR048_012646 [Dryococelus australis]|uniref:Uncharacterized protein n=1 Tax=Dryococelus australis TaxID=614101 RepID=A0ABQ9HQK8_9NEOP|nr:hypothetical protein PR048_012646 [Dryococelus australis]
MRLSPATVWRVLHDQSLFPHYQQQVQVMGSRNYPQCLQITQWYLQHCQAEPGFTKCVLFTYEDIPLAVGNAMWFEHDGAPAHFGEAVRSYLNARFTDHWIGPGGILGGRLAYWTFQPGLLPVGCNEFTCIRDPNEQRGGSCASNLYRRWVQVTWSNGCQLGVKAMLQKGFQVCGDHRPCRYSENATAYADITCCHCFGLFHVLSQLSFPHCVVGQEREDALVVIKITLPLLPGVGGGSNIVTDKDELQPSVTEYAGIPLPLVSQEREDVMMPYKPEHFSCQAEKNALTQQNSLQFTVYLAAYPMVLESPGLLRTDVQCMFALDGSWATTTRSTPAYFCITLTMPPSRPISVRHLDVVACCGANTNICAWPVQKELLSLGRAKLRKYSPFQWMQAVRKRKMTGVAVTGKELEERCKLEMENHKQVLDKEYEGLLTQFSKELERLQMRHQQELERKVLTLQADDRTRWTSRWGSGHCSRNSIQPSAMEKKAILTVEETVKRHHDETHTHYVTATVRHLDQSDRLQPDIPAAKKQMRISRNTPATLSHHETSRFQYALLMSKDAISACEFERGSIIGLRETGLLYCGISARTGHASITVIPVLHQ